MTEQPLTYRTSRGLKAKDFNRLLKDIKEHGGKFNQDDKTWTIDPGHHIVTMHCRHNAEWNAHVQPGPAEALPEDPAGMLARRMRLGQWVELVTP